MMMLGISGPFSCLRFEDDRAARFVRSGDAGHISGGGLSSSPSGVGSTPCSRRYASNGWEWLCRFATGYACIATPRSGHAQVSPGRSFSGDRYASGPDNVPIQTSGYAVLCARRPIRRHSSHARSGAWRAAAHTRVMLIEYQIAPFGPTRAPSGEPCRHVESIVASNSLACSSDAAPHRMAHGCTSNHSASSPMTAPGPYARRNHRPFHSPATRARRTSAKARASPAVASSPKRAARAAYTGSTHAAIAEFNTDSPCATISALSTPDCWMAVSFQSAFRIRTWPCAPVPTWSTKNRNCRRRFSANDTGSALWTGWYGTGAANAERSPVAAAYSAASHNAHRFWSDGRNTSVHGCLMPSSAYGRSPSGPPHEHVLRNTDNARSGSRWTNGSACWSGSRAAPLNPCRNEYAEPWFRVCPPSTPSTHAPPVSNAACHANSGDTVGSRARSAPRLPA